MTGGNSSNEYSSSTLVEASKIPVSTAYAPSTFPTVGCFKGYGAGVQTAPVGVSLGGGKIDENCAILEAAGRAHNLLAFCKVYVSNKYVKKAGVTLADCLNAPPVPEVRTVVPVLSTPVPQIIVIPVGVTLTQPAITLPVTPSVRKTIRKSVAKKRPSVCHQEIVNRCVVTN